jgi:hypothetical protein
MNPNTRKDAPAFDFYPERWAHGTRHLTKEERCDFLDLLAVQWTDDGIVDDLPRIARLLGYRSAEDIPPMVLEKFPVAADGKRRHPFLEKLRAEQRSRIDSRKRGAVLTNRKRWGHESADTRDRLEPGDGAAPAETQGEFAPEITANDLAMAPRETNDGESMNGWDSRAPCTEPASSLSDGPASSERVALESPPLTTHRPPQSSSGSSSPPALTREPLGVSDKSNNSLPDSFPTLPEVQAHGVAIGAGPECCEAFWQECEAVQWVNKHGVPIADWRPLLARFRTRWNAIEAERLRPPPGAMRRKIESGKPDRSRPARAAASAASGELNRPGRYAGKSKPQPVAIYA